MANDQLNITDVTTVRVNVQQQPSFWGAFCLLFIGVIIWQHIGWILAGAVIVAAVYLLWRRWRAQDAEVKGIRARADQQNNWIYEGDPRGVYGDSYEGQVK